MIGHVSDMVSKIAHLPRKRFTNDTLWGRSIDKMASVPFSVGKRPSGVMQSPKTYRLSEKKNLEGLNCKPNV